MATYTRKTCRDLFKSLSTARMGILVATLSLALLACSQLREYSVEYPVYRLPTKGFKDITFLGVSRSAKIPAATQDRLTEELQRCGQYQKVNKLNKVFDIESLDRDATLKRLKSDVSNFQDARYVHGVLAIEQLGVEKTESTRAIDVVTLTHGVDHLWYPSFGYTGRPMAEFFGTEELGPKITFSSRKYSQKLFQKTMTWRFVLYNKLTNSLVIDKKVKMSVGLKNYSAKPRVTEKMMEAALGREMMEHIAGYLCPKIAHAERLLLARNDDSKPNLLVNEGIDLASDDRWEAAANQWKKAILVDKSSAMAYHNLGIYYEKFGNIPAAMEEFAKAKNVGAADYQPKLYDQALEIYRPQIKMPTNDVRVYGVGSAQWILLHGGERLNYRIGREYPVYRLQRLGASPDFGFHGIELIEVGKVTLVKQDSPFVLGRITQFVEPGGIKMGDVLSVNLD